VYHSCLYQILRPAENCAPTGTDQLQTVHLQAPTYIKINYESNFQALQGV